MQLQDASLCKEKGDQVIDDEKSKTNTMADTMTKTKTNTKTNTKADTTRSSWFNCALRDDEAVYWVIIGHYEAVEVGN